MAKILVGVKDRFKRILFYEKEVIEGINLKTKGYKILFEILVKGNYNKAEEFPYIFRMRKHSTSKLNTKEFCCFLAK